MKLQKIIFYILLMLLSLWFLDLSFNANAISRALPVLSLVEKGHWYIDGFENFTRDKSKVGIHYYSDKAPLSSMIVLPFYYVFGKIKPLQDTHQKIERILLCGIFLTGGLPFFAVAFLFLQKIVQKEWIFPFLFASFVWAYSGVYFGHLLAGLFLLLTYRCLFEKNFPFLAGIWMGLGFLSEFPVALAFPLWAVWILLKERNVSKFFLFFLATLPAFVALALYNQSITGSPFHMVYSFVVDEEFSQMKHVLGFGFPQFSGIYGLLLSPSRGLLIYAPSLLLALYVLFKRVSLKKILSFVCHPSISFFISSLLLFSSYYMWDGGWCYGPRHLIPAYLLLSYELIPWMEKQMPFSKISLCIASIGFPIVWMAKMTMIYLPTTYSNPIFEFIIPNFFSGRWNQDSLPQRLLGLNQSISCLLFISVLFMFLYLLKLSKSPSPR